MERSEVHIPDILQVRPGNVLKGGHVRHVDWKHVRVEHLQSVRQSDGQLLVQEHSRNNQSALVLGFKDMSIQRKKESVLGYSVHHRIVVFLFTLVETHPSFPSFHSILFLGSVLVIEGGDRADI